MEYFALAALVSYASCSVFLSDSFASATVFCSVTAAISASVISSVTVTRIAFLTVTVYSALLPATSEAEKSSGRVTVIFCSEPTFTPESFSRTAAGREEEAEEPSVKETLSPLEPSNSLPSAVAVKSTVRTSPSLVSSPSASSASYS